MKNTVRIIKISPIVINLYITIVLVLSLLNIELISVDYILGHSLLVDALLWNLSKRFKFCTWHRILITNLFIQSFIQLIDVYSNFAIEIWIIFAVSVISIIVSAITSTILYFKYGCCKIEESK